MIVFRNETHNVKILSDSPYFAYGTWMCCERGEGEEEVENQGWSRVKVSSQGTDLIGSQWSLRMRANEAEQNSTGCAKDFYSTPHFSSFRIVSKIVSSVVARCRRSAATLSASRLGSQQFYKQYRYLVFA